MRQENVVAEIAKLESSLSEADRLFKSCSVFETELRNYQLGLVKMYNNHLFFLRELLAQYDAPKPEPPEPQVSEVNLNARCTVRLRKRGVDAIELNRLQFGLPPKDYSAGDLYTGTLWHIMELFGPAMDMGFDPPIDTRIKLHTGNRAEGDSLCLRHAEP